MVLSLKMAHAKLRLPRRAPFANLYESLAYAINGALALLLYIVWGVENWHREHAIARKVKRVASAPAFTQTLANKELSHGARICQPRQFWKGANS